MKDNKTQVPVSITVKDGVCQGGIHVVGQVFKVDETTPEGICLGAWEAIAPYLMTLCYGGDFPWEDENGVAVIHCPDPCGITLKLSRID
ncbi:TIGR04076 family protein [candidate division KSB1 bacterium]|nr:TIGR04076 family protein [candidate division KSB1 bacterium]